MIIGTAGHIDHGKTALVRALTGVDTDRLAEEKRRGITIELGYAYTGDLGFVDVPGHERFVHTMLAGATGIDAALLAVAADDGVMPQTSEHAAILDLLGIDRGVVAVTKADIAPARIDGVADQVRSLLAGTGLGDAPILPVSAHTGAGVDAVRGALVAIGPRGRDDAGFPRLAIDRVFTLPGAGLIVTGTLVAGVIRVDDRLVISPSGLDLRVRGLHAQNRPAEQAGPGQRVALNITGPRLAKDAIARGDWVLHPDIHVPTAQLDARVRLLPQEGRALTPDTSLHVHLGAAHVTARGYPVSAPRIEPGEEGILRLMLDRPLGALARDRLILRDAAATRTVGGGVVIDPFPPRRRRRTEARLAALHAMDTPDPAAALRGLLAVPPGWTDRRHFVCARNLPGPQAEAVLDAAAAETLGDLAIAQPVHAALRSALTGALAEHHAAAPDQPGLQPERLRLLLPGRPPIPAFRGLLEAGLRTRAIEQDGPWLRLPAHRATLSPADERLWLQIHALIAADRFRPPRARDLARTFATAEGDMRAMLKRLGRMGRVVEVAHDHFFLRETVAEIVGFLADIEAGDPDHIIRAAALRDRLANGRKVAIQILEFLDRAGVTIRTGDERRVRPDRLDLFGAAPRSRPAA